MVMLNQSLIIKQIVPNGDCALLFRFEANELDIKAIHALANDLIRRPFAAQVNVIPAHDSLVLVFKDKSNHQLDWEAEVQKRIDRLTIDKKSSVVHKIPVCYEVGVAADLKHVCEKTGLTENELIAAHTKPLYDVIMLGFLPGFAYLSNNDIRINLPRKSNPTLSVPAGSIAVANNLTGLYALSSPGGWHVIGRTPLSFLDWRREPANLIKPLDQIKFYAVDKQAFNAMRKNNEH